MPIDSGPVNKPHFALATALLPYKAGLRDDRREVRISATLQEEHGRTIYLTMTSAVFIQTLKNFRRYADRKGIVIS